MMDRSDRIRIIDAAKEMLLKRFGKIPDTAIILGSGLNSFVDSLTILDSIHYSDIPGFPIPSIKEHEGKVVYTSIDGGEVLIYQGRVHYYEGFSMQEVTFGVRVLGALRVRRLIVTNAAGGINLDFKAGDLMLIQDHINLMGINPLIGRHDERFGERFPDMTEAYDRGLRMVAKEVAGELGIDLKEGVYVALSGPSYETPHEIKFLRMIGADAVGMSTVPEVIVARQEGIKVLGVSCITNMAAGITGQILTHEEVRKTAESVKTDFSRLMKGILRRIFEEDI